MLQEIENSRVPEMRRVLQSLQGCGRMLPTNWSDLFPVLQLLREHLRQLPGMLRGVRQTFQEHTGMLQVVAPLLCEGHQVFEGLFPVLGCRRRKMLQNVLRRFQRSLRMLRSLQALLSKDVASLPQ